MSIWTMLYIACYEVLSPGNTDRASACLHQSAWCVLASEVEESTKTPSELATSCLKEQLDQIRKEK